MEITEGDSEEGEEEVVVEEVKNTFVLCVALKLLRVAHQSCSMNLQNSTRRR
jgi:hypothetical protein